MLVRALCMLMFVALVVGAFGCGRGHFFYDTREYLCVLGGLPAPTDYGNASAHASFAESFALFHVDGDAAALKRTRPLVHAWFASGGHLSSRDRS